MSLWPVRAFPFRETSNGVAVITTFVTTIGAAIHVSLWTSIRNTMTRWTVTAFPFCETFNGVAVITTFVTTEATAIHVSISTSIRNAMLHNFFRL